MNKENFDFTKYPPPILFDIKGTEIKAGDYIALTNGKESHEGYVQQHIDSKRLFIVTHPQLICQMLDLHTYIQKEFTVSIAYGGAHFRFNPQGTNYTYLQLKQAGMTHQQMITSGYGEWI
jgi:hypothetical protein